MKSMEKSNMTAVDWLIKQLAENWFDENISFIDLYKQAKEMEKQQLEEAYRTSIKDSIDAKQ